MLLDCPELMPYCIKMNISNKSPSALYSNRRLPLVPFIEKNLEEEAIVSIFPGCIICYELGEEFAPIDDEIKTFRCKDGEGFYLSLNGDFSKIPPRLTEIKIEKGKTDQFAKEGRQGESPYIVYGTTFDEDAKNPTTKRIPLATIRKQGEEFKIEGFASSSGIKIQHEQFYLHPYAYVKFETEQTPEEVIIVFSLFK